MSITIVIPCYKRAEYLITALQTVRSQTAIKFVDKIIVSENSRSLESKKVCEQFPDLPIEYHQQEKDLTVVEHLSWIINQSKSTYTAMLHDDDWWNPTHLETGLKVLKENKRASCYFSNFIFCKNEIAKGAFFHYPDVVSHFAHKTNSVDPIELNFQSVATIAYLYTPFHMSAMISNTDILKIVNMEALLIAKPWYADRIMYPYLAVYGTLFFNPEVLCCVRLHSNNDANSFDFKERINSHKEGSEKINNLAFKHKLDISQKWCEVKSTISNADWDLIQNVYKAYFGETQDMNSPFYVNHDNKTFKKLIKLILPPGILAIINKLKRTKNSDT